MNKVIQTIGTVKALEVLGKIESRTNKVPQANLQFAPMLHLVVNLFYCYGCLVIGLILFVLTPLESEILGVIISFAIFYIAA
jgi:hypothetical protein